MNNEYIKLLTKRFQTTMIGSLFEFEKTFGYLWGQNKEFEDLSSKELEFLDLWENARNNILNNGNSQLRKAIADLSNVYDTKYHYKFYTNKKGDYR